MVFKELWRNDYNHFKDYVEKNPSKMHPTNYGNSKFKINFDQYVHKLRRKLLKQEVCTECFYYYFKKNMIYTDKPYVEAKLESEFWWYCSDECVEYRKEINLL